MPFNYDENQWRHGPIVASDSEQKEFIHADPFSANYIVNGKTEFVSLWRWNDMFLVEE